MTEAESESGDLDMAREDTKVWVIKGARKRSPGVVAGVWDIETVTGTRQAKVREKYWNRKYKNDANVKIIRARG
jgi:hypothetical protein